MASATNVYVKGLPANCTEAMLQNEFQPFGPIASVKVAKEGGYGFVHFAHSTAASKAIADMNGCIWHGSKLVVRNADNDVGERKAAMAGAPLKPMNVAPNPIECKVCFFAYDNMQRMPKLMDCGHTICLACAMRVAQEGSTKPGRAPCKFGAGCNKGAACTFMHESTTVQCPHCRAITLVDGGRANLSLMKTNFQLLDVVPQPATSCGGHPGGGIGVPQVNSGAGQRNPRSSSNHGRNSSHGPSRTHRSSSNHIGYGGQPAAPGPMATGGAPKAALQPQKLMDDAMKKPPLGKASLKDVLMFKTTDGTAKHYPEWMECRTAAGVPQQVRYKRVRHPNGSVQTNAELWRAKTIPKGAICSFYSKTGICKLDQACKFEHIEFQHVANMSFNKPALLFTVSGFAPYDPDEMLPLKDGVAPPLQLQFTADGQACAASKPGRASAPLAQGGPLRVQHPAAASPLLARTQLQLPRAPGASKYKVQDGSILFFFEYPDSTGVHFERVILYQLDVQQETFVMDPHGPFSLPNNYVNCAAATKKYLLLSYWPYNKEEVKLIKDGLLKEQSANARIQQLQQQVHSLQGTVASLAQQVDAFQRAEVERKRQMEEMRKQQAAQRALEDEARRQNAAAQARYYDSLRLRDPIHLYVRDRGQLKLVLDYHEGAFDLQICDDSMYVEFPQGHQHHFEIQRTAFQVSQAVVPDKLCPYF